MRGIVPVSTLPAAPSTAAASPRGLQLLKCTERGRRIMVREATSSPLHPQETFNHESAPLISCSGTPNLSPLVFSPSEASVHCDIEDCPSSTSSAPCCEACPAVTPMVPTLMCRRQTDVNGDLLRRSVDTVSAVMKLP